MGLTTFLTWASLVLRDLDCERNHHWFENRKVEMIDYLLEQRDGQINSLYEFDLFDIVL